MKPSQLVAKSSSGFLLACSLAVLGGLVPGAPTTLAAQGPPPVQGTIALEGTMKKVYAAANTVIVTTIDGVEYIVHFTKDLVVHGGKGTGVDALQGLREGSTVVVHYTVSGSDAAAQEIDRVGDDGLKVTEGVVVRIDRRRKQITIRFDDGKTDTFQLTERAAIDAGQDVDQATPGTTRVTVYYSDESGRKVAHFFKKSS